MSLAAAEDALTIVDAAAMAVRRDILFPGLSLDLSRVIAYTNLETLNKVFHAHLWNHVYRDRIAALRDVTLDHLPDGAMLYGGGKFLVGCAGGLVAEQVLSRWTENLPDLAKTCRTERPVIEVNAPCLMVARYGVGTWGHWLGELLPKIVVAHQRFPRRFTFVLPRAILTASGRGSIWTSIRESLAFHGVSDDDILWLEDDKNYRFAQLACMSGIWSDQMIHPGVVTTMRDAAGLRPENDAGDPAGLRWIALLRRDTRTRNITNADEVAALLRQRGFEIVEPSGLSFTDQVATFAGAGTIFSVLGSGLTNIIYSPPGVRIVSAAPQDFGDRFFYALMQNRAARYADLRGPVAEPNKTTYHWSSFHMDIDVLQAGFDALGLSGGPAAPPDPPVSAEAEFERARDAAARGELERARQIWSSAPLPAAPGETCLRDAEALRQSGHAAAAEALLAIAVERLPAEPSLWVERIGVANHRRAWAEAARLCEQMRARFPAHYLGYLLGMQALHRAGDAAASDRLAEDAMARFPGIGDIVIEYALAAGQRGDRLEAVRRWERMRQIFPSDPRAYAGLSEALYCANRLDDAEAVLDQAIALLTPAAQPGQRLLRMSIRIARERHRWSEALREEQRFTTYYPAETFLDPYLIDGILAPCRELAGIVDAAECLAAQIKDAPGAEAIGPFIDYLFRGGPIPPAASDPGKLDAQYREALLGLRGLIDAETRQLRPQMLRRTLVSPATHDALTVLPWSPLALLTHLVLSRIVPRRRAAVLVTMRDDGISILEWIAHYRAVGFEGIFVYTNDNADGSDELLQALCGAGIITLIDNQTSGSVSPQAKAFAHSIHFLPELRDYEWVFYADSDEFLVPAEQFDCNIQNVLASVKDKFGAQPPVAICYHWRWYVSAYEFARTHALLLEKFRHATTYGLAKSMVRLADTLTMKRLHFPYAFASGFFVDSALDVIAESRDRNKDAIWQYRTSCYDGGQVNHYWCKSFEEFLIKKRRGDALTGIGAEAYRKDLDLFFSTNAPETTANHVPPPPILLSRVRAQLAGLRREPGLAAIERKVDDGFDGLVASLGTRADLIALYDGVASRRSLPPFAELPRNRAGQLRAPEHGGRDYKLVLAELHSTLRPATYVEIGPARSQTLAMSKAVSVAIDPAFRPAAGAAEPACHLFRMSSDAFFRSHSLQDIFRRPVDLAFVDGMHLFECVLRDFMNVEAACGRDSLCVLHDCLPTDVHMARRDLADMTHADIARHADWWTGDAWKILPILKKYRPDLQVICLDAPPTGLVLVANLDPGSTILRDGYDAIIAEFRDVELHRHGVAALHRDAGIRPTTDLPMLLAPPAPSGGPKRNIVAKLAIFSCHHREPEIVLDTRLFKTLVSGIPAPPGAGFITDLDGLNIAERNVYSEMRHQYYIWKNLLADHSHVGFEHYRRPFFIDPLPAARLRQEYRDLFVLRSHFLSTHARFEEVGTKVFGQYMAMRGSLDEASIVATQDWLCTYDAVVIRGDATNIERHWKNHHDPAVWDSMVEICRMSSLSGGVAYPFDFDIRFNYWLNSYILRIELFQEYMTFCFDVLAQFEAHSPPRAGRLFGYMAERLFNFWLHRKRLEDPRLHVLELPFLLHKPELDAAG